MAYSAPDVDAGERPPRAALPVSRARRALPYVLLLPVAAALAVGVHYLIHPRVTVEDDGHAITYAVAAAHTWTAVAALAAAAVFGVLACVSGARGVAPRAASLAGAAAVIALAMLVPVWHHHAARATLAPDALTTRAPGRLTPGEPLTLKFDDLGGVQFRNGVNDRPSRQQYWFAKNGRPTEFELGPLTEAVKPALIAIAKSRGAKVAE